MILDNLLKDKNGFLTLFDGILAILIILIALVGFNIVINMNNSSYSVETKNTLTSQDTMELMAIKADENSFSILENIKYNLEINDNSEQSIYEMSILAGNFLNKTIPNDNYCLTEINQLNGRIIAVNGDLNLAENISSSIRHIENYIFVLRVWVV